MLKLSIFLLTLCLFTPQFSFASEGTPEFKVLTPLELKQAFTSLQPVSVSVGNFGNVPWGQTVLGNLFYAKPHDACTELDPIPIQRDGSGNSNEGEMPILIADRGGCTFVMKARNAQLAGAKLLIVKDKTEENLAFVMPVDDGNGDSVSIPLVMINKKTGDLFEDYLQKSNQVTITVKFPVPKTYDRVDYEIWLSSSDKNSFDIIKDFAKYQARLGNLANMTVHYAIWYCHECAERNFNDSSNVNCLSGGRYCSPDPDGAGNLTGKDTLLEDLRQICLYKQNSAMWWAYHMQFPGSCLDSERLESCSYSTIENIRADLEGVKNCVKDSFIGSKNQLLDDNKILRAEREIFLQRGILTWPSVVINNMTYRAICAGFSNRPAECEESKYSPYSYNPANPLDSQRSAPNKQKSHFWMIMFVILIAIAVFTALFILYRRQMKRDILQELDYKISSTMHRYLAMKDDGGEINLSTMRGGDD